MLSEEVDSAALRENVALVQGRIAEAARSAGRLPEEVALVAVSKFKDAAIVAAANQLDFFCYGENHVQEIVQKAAVHAYGDKPVHMIGHLQTNKVSKIVGLCPMIQSVDSFHLASEIAKRAVALGITQEVLLEVNIGGEESKSGLLPGVLREEMEKIAMLKGIKVKGLMAVPPIAVRPGENKRYFAAMHQLFVDIEGEKYDNVNMECLSMGMSGDYEDAIAEGATMVRIGTAIFGARDYDRH